MEYIGIVVAFLAMFFTGYQTYLSRKHNELSVIPNLTIWEQELEEGGLSYELRNNGVGPALITNIDFFVDGVRVQGEKIQLYKEIVKMLLPAIQCHVSGSYLEPGYMLPAKEKIELIKVLFPKPFIITKSQLASSIKRVSVLIEYKSIYQKKFKFESKKQAIF